MSNSLLNISMITKESLMILKNNLGMGSRVNRQYDDQFARKGAKIGSVVNIRKPVRYTTTSGPALNLQDQTDQSVALTLDTQEHVDFSFTSNEMTLNVEQMGERYIKPAIVALANKIDLDLCAKYSSIYNAVGTPGSTPSSLSTYLSAMQKLYENGAPIDDKFHIGLTPAAQNGAIDALKGLFQSSTQIAQQYEKGMMGKAIGANWFMDQNLNSFTTGNNHGDTVLVNSAVAADGDSSIAMDGFGTNTTGVAAVGDVFTIDGIFNVNPQSRQSTGSLKQFVVTAAADSNGSGQATISFSPSLQSTGSYQNIDALPADNAAVTFVQGSADATASPQNLAFHRDAFCLAMADLDIPQGGVIAADRASDPDSGISLRVIQSYDVVNDRNICRIDVLYGITSLYPELACRIYG